MAKSSPAAQPHETRPTPSLCLRTSNPIIPAATSSSSQIISPATTVLRRGPGWRASAPASRLHSYGGVLAQPGPEGWLGSVGASFVVMRSSDRVLPIPGRLNRPPALPPLNSIIAPSLGSGDDLPRIIVTIGVSSLTEFNERSIRGARSSADSRPR